MKDRILIIKLTRPQTKQLPEIEKYIEVISVDDIELKEMEEALHRTKNKKSAGSGSVNSELINL